MEKNNKQLSERRMEIYRKYGLKPTIVVKTGAGVIVSMKKHENGGKQNV